MIRITLATDGETYLLWDEGVIGGCYGSAEAAERVVFLYGLWYDAKSDTERQDIVEMVLSIPERPCPAEYLEYFAR